MCKVDKQKKGRPKSTLSLTNLKQSVLFSEVHANQLNECGDQEHKTPLVSKSYEYKSCKL